jgi:hypothetical protein
MRAPPALTLDDDGRLSRLPAYPTLRIGSRDLAVCWRHLRNPTGVTIYLEVEAETEAERRV